MEEMRGAIESLLNHRSITRRAPTKGKCYSQESKKGTDSETYRVKQIRAKYADNVSLPPPSTNWADWLNTLGREMYLCRALDRLNFEYPSDSTL